MTGAAPLLQAEGLARRYGSVIALKSAALSVRAGEVHALMGANGAGKSTLVKILTGVIRPDSGTLAIRGRSVRFHSPAAARRAGVVSVYQEPALVPDLSVAQNLRLAGVGAEDVRALLGDLGLPALDLGTMVRDLPYATLRLIDLARALASDPQVLLLDEITAALPADLAEGVFAMVARWRGRGRSVLFISHRMTEVARLCDRATVLRDGSDVGVLDPVQGSEERIVALMLGAAVAAGPRGTGRGVAVAGECRAALEVRDLRSGHALDGVSFTLRAGEVLGIAALEGQGQDQLFGCLAGLRRPDGGTIVAEGRRLDMRHPADAVRAGIVLVPADRVQALLMQRPIRENVALPTFGRLRAWGAIRMAAERAAVGAAVIRLQIDTRAEAELRQLSGGNQQKVVIARWIAAGFKVLLCFDPTRGIDIGTKRQIYALLRNVAGSGASVLLFTSELAEIPLACDRALILFGGRIVGELDAASADEATLLRAAHGLTAPAAVPA